MTRTTNAGLAMVAAFALLLGISLFVFVRFDRPGFVGAGIGAAVGIANLVVGLWLARRALRRGMKSAMGTLLGGFFARLVLLGGLVVVFARTDAVSEIAFALVFMVFFFLYVGAEIVLINGALHGARGSA